MRTELNNTVSMLTRGTGNYNTNHCIIPPKVLQSGIYYRTTNQSVINYFTFCKEKNRKWIWKNGG
jgi:hypothetical protein